MLTLLNIKNIMLGEKSKFQEDTYVVVSLIKYKIKQINNKIKQTYN